MEKSDLSFAYRIPKQASYHLFNLFPRFKESSLHLRNYRSLLSRLIIERKITDYKPYTSKWFLNLYLLTKVTVLAGHVIETKLVSDVDECALFWRLQLSLVQPGICGRRDENLRTQSLHERTGRGVYCKKTRLRVLRIGPAAMHDEFVKCEISIVSVFTIARKSIIYVTIVSAENKPKMRTLGQW